MFLYLKSARFAIRGVQRTDLIHFHRWWNDKTLMKEVGAEDFEIGLEELELRYWPRWRAPSRHDQWMHVICRDQQPIGELTYQWLAEGSKTIEIHLKIALPTLWNRGLGSQVLHTFISGLFHALDVERVLLNPGVHNNRMHAVCIRLGLRAGEASEDAIPFTVIRTDWTPAKRFPTK